MKGRGSDDSNFRILVTKEPQETLQSLRPHFGHLEHMREAVTINRREGNQETLRRGTVRRQR
jgi:hypothetical protein